jgi:hypothetical protein
VPRSSGAQNYFSSVAYGDGKFVAVGYGPFKQILQAPGAEFKNVRIGHSSIRGEVSFPDRVSGTTDDTHPPR